MGGKLLPMRMRCDVACCSTLGSTRSSNSPHTSIKGYHAMSSLVTVDTVRTWLEHNRMGDYADGIVDILGVDTVEDLELVTQADFRSVGVKPVQVRRLVRAVGTLPPPRSKSAGLQKRQINHDDNMTECGLGEESDKADADVDRLDVQQF